jgi:hypothetical protein
MFHVVSANPALSYPYDNVAISKGNSHDSSKRIFIMSNLLMLLIRFIGVFVFFLTGELLLYVITFGRHRFRESIKRSHELDNYAKGQLLFEASYYIGIIFWVCVIVIVNKYIY